MTVSFNHEQTTLSSDWQVVHNLNTTDVNVSVILDTDGDGDITTGNQQNVMPGHVKITNNNTVNVTFSAPRCGRVRVTAAINPHANITLGL
jgi:hypothetical protein